jgi:hypothetical protein
VPAIARSEGVATPTTPKSGSVPIGELEGRKAMTTRRRFSIAPLLFSAACFTTPFSLTTLLRAESFSLEASPSTVYLKQDDKATSTITIHPAGAFNGSVALLASHLPPGVTVSFDPDSTTSASKVVFVAAKEAATGLSSITITGTSGNLAQSAAISLAVTAATGALGQWSIRSSASEVQYPNSRYH